MRALRPDRKSTRLNSSHTVIYTLSLHDALPIFEAALTPAERTSFSVQHLVKTGDPLVEIVEYARLAPRSEEHTSELQSHRDLHSFPTRRSSDLRGGAHAGGANVVLGAAPGEDRRPAGRDCRVCAPCA